MDILVPVCAQTTGFLSELHVCSHACSLCIATSRGYIFMQGKLMERRSY
jgi:hypothetical protein